MTRNLIIALIMAMTPLTVKAEEIKEQQQLTILQVINIGNALQNLTTYTSTDKDGKSIQIPYKFSSYALLLMAEDIQKSESVKKNYQQAYFALVKQTYGSIDKIPTNVSDDKKMDFDAQVEKIFNSPAHVSMLSIHKKDLCLEVAPPACEIANPIPLNILSLLLPIIKD